ncbi:MAG TPA: WD40 repeat domain-containing protein [Candidatus Poseidoniales archaeon]|nr:WD40 repeat domain-containing protein [Candidatus Poseidoniales archaeon]
MGEFVIDQFPGLMCLETDPITGEMFKGTHDGAIIAITDKGTIRQRWDCHSDYVWDLALDDQGRWVATASQDGSVTIRKRSNGKHVETLLYHKGPVTTVDFSPCGHLIASGSIDRLVTVHEVATGERITILAKHEGYVEKVLFHPDGDHILTASHDGKIRYWEARSGELEQEADLKSGYLWDLAWLDDGTEVAVATENGGILILDMNDLSIKSSMIVHQGAVRSLYSHPDWGCFVSGGDDGKVLLWSSRLRECIATVTRHGGSVHGVGINTKNENIVSIGADRLTSHHPVNDLLKEEIEPFVLAGLQWNVARRIVFGLTDRKSAIRILQAEAALPGMSEVLLAADIPANDIPKVVEDITWWGKEHPQILEGLREGRITYHTARSMIEDWGLMGNDEAIDYILRGADLELVALRYGYGTD